MKERITILVAEDHTLIREAWSFMLNNDHRFRVIGETNNSYAAVEKARELHPDVVILDLHTRGLEAVAQICLHAPATKILGVCERTRPLHARRLVQAGAMGCITKDSGSYEMFTAIIEIHEGREYVCDDIKDALAEMMISARPGQGGGINSLSQREIEIIGYIRQGASSKEIAGQLNIAVKTIEAHRYNIMRKLGLRNVASLVNYVNNYQLELEERFAM